MINLRNYRYLLLLFVLLLPALACTLGEKQSELPQPPSGYIEPQDEAAQRVKENFNQSLQEATGNNEFRFRLSNAEVTSIVAEALQTRADVPVSEPQIWFTAGKVYMTGNIEGLGPTVLPALIIGIPVVTTDGQLQIELDEAKMGAFEVPDGVIENVTQTINETLTDLQLEIQITAIEVAEGELLIAGKRVSR